ncbi:MAG: DUF421 domain-containing protein [Acidimicrobiia bacterium]|nr:DUF421 domain-containing protein [Acidimicrobiia bacterium]
MHLLAITIQSNLTTMGIPLAEKVIRTVAVYAGLIVLLRVGGKRDLAQLNSFDLVVLLLLSNVVQNAIIGNDNSLTGGLIGAVVLIAANGVVNRASRRNEVAVKVFEGTETELVSDGELHHDAIRHLGLREADVRVALLRQGASNVDEVSRAVIEPGGSIVVTLRPGSENATKDDLAVLEAKLDRLLAAQGS